MNDWIFQSILPLVNKDVEPQTPFVSKTDKILCRCRNCGQVFTSTSTKILAQRLHGTSECKWSYNNRISPSEANELIKKLEKVWKSYSETCSFEVGLDLDELAVSIKENDNQDYEWIKIDDLLARGNYFRKRERLNKLIAEANAPQADTSDPGDNDNKEINEPVQNVYMFYDTKLKTSLTCTVSELCDYAHRKKVYGEYDEIRQFKWFKKRFQLIRHTHRNDGYTYIRRKCKYVHYCFRTGNYKCNPCTMVDEPYYRIDEFKKLASESNPDIEIISEFDGSRVPLKCKCKKCEYVFEQTPTSLVNMVTCPMCVSSRGEQMVANYLTNNGIAFEREKSFDDLVDKKNLRFDFYLPELNAVIEYDGMQHFKPVMYFSKNIEEATQKYEITKKHDMMKKKYCDSKNIHLLRIRYDDKDAKGMLKSFINRVKRMSRDKENT